MIPTELAAVARRVESGERPIATVRTLLGWFGQARRGYWVVNTIRDALKASLLATEPDFENAWIDGQIVRRVRPHLAATINFATRDRRRTASPPVRAATRHPTRTPPSRMDGDQGWSRGIVVGWHPPPRRHSYTAGLRATGPAQSAPPRVLGRRTPLVSSRWPPPLVTPPCTEPGDARAWATPCEKSCV